MATIVYVLKAEILRAAREEAKSATANLQATVSHEE